MIKYRPLLVIASILAVSCLGWLVLVRTPQTFKRVVQKYPKGTLAKNVLDDYRGRVELKRTKNVVAFDPREDEKQTYVFYFIRLPWADAEMEFNYYQQLIRIQKISELKTPD